MLRGSLLAEESKCFLARTADFFVYPRRPGLHLLVHPVTAGFIVDDTYPFADRVQDQVGLLGNQCSLEREEIGGVGEDRGEMVFAKDVDGLVNGGNLHDITGTPQ